MSHGEGGAFLSNGWEKLKCWTNVAVNVVGSVMFIDRVARVARVGTCEFNINATGRLRNSRLVETFILWKQVMKVQFLSSFATRISFLEMSVNVSRIWARTRAPRSKLLCAPTTWSYV
jgi:hypothetical protein